MGKTFTATGGSGAYTWALASGSLPSGVTLDEARGTIAGTPRAAGAFTVSVAASVGEGRVAAALSSLVVAPRLGIRTTALKPANADSAYRARLATTGGVPPVTWKVVRGALPAGVRLARRTGTVTGVPRRTGRFPMTVEARDALGVKAKKSLVLLVRS
jgi:hypothetical protein